MSSVMPMDEHMKKWISRAIKDHLNSGDENVPLMCLCGICGDRATGKHYGALSCDGCKGFFRRSVRNNNVYICRFDRRCEINKDKRNQCRYCRLRHCFKVGMKITAVQNERDKIGKHRGGHQEELEPNQGLSVESLRNAEVKCRELPGNCDAPNGIDYRRTKHATLGDLSENVKRQLLSVVAWAKAMPIFERLILSDQLALIKASAVHNLVLGSVRRSMHLEDVINFGNDCILTCGGYAKRRKGGSGELIDVGFRIIKELLEPLCKAQMDITEFASLKAIVFFDPFVKNLTDPDKVSRARSQVQMNLGDYINDHQYDFRGRFGDLLLTLPSLKEISQKLMQLFNEAGFYDDALFSNTASRLLADPSVRIAPIVSLPQAAVIEPLKSTKGKRPLPVKTENDGDTDSSATLSSPNSPGMMDLDSMEHITVKVEPDFENYYENSS